MKWSRRFCYWLISSCSAKQGFWGKTSEGLGNLQGQGCSSVGTESHQHAANASSIPRCGKGFFSRSQLLVQTLVIQCPYTPCAITCINICVHIKDHVLHVRVWWIMETLKHPACTVGWVVRLPQLAFPGTATQISHGKNPNEAVQL